jgi:cell division protein FtsI/penicillin-binding protein 2
MDRNRLKNRHQPNRKRQSRHRKRILFLQAGLLALLVVIAWRVRYIQRVYGPELLRTAGQVQDEEHTVLAARGALLDNAGDRLAYDVPAFMMDIETSAFPDKATLANVLSQALQLPEDKVLPELQKDSKWVRWQHPVSEPQKEKIQAELTKTKHDQNVTFTPTEQRFYPYGTFAANTIGYVGPGNVGDGGLEAEYNTWLTGENGQVDYTQDAQGFPIPTSVHVVKQPKPGDNVETTIDQTVQGFVEHEMDGIVSKYHPAHAAIIVMNPKTGAILGMSSRPTYNPNDYAQASPDALSNNWAVNSRFEPGSTFKVIVLAAALATHTISLDETFQSGHIDVGGSRIYDWNSTGWGTITFRQALEYSSNVGFATIAMKLGWPNLLKYMQSFGFMQKTGIDLPAEASSILFPPSDQHKIQLATSGFGQGISVTPLQQMAAMGAIANGGDLMKPYLAKAIVDANGKIVKNINPTVVRQGLLPQDVVSAVNQTMVLDVSKGIDSEAIIKGYDVAGKTGTAQAVAPNGQYYTDRFNVSFIGYAPATDPKVEVYVTVNWPKAAEANTWGSTIATPPAKNILEDCLQYYHIPPNGDAASLTDAKTDSQTASKYVETPNVVGKSQTQVGGILKAAGLSPVWIGGGSAVNRQWPPAGLEVPVPSKLYVWLPGGTSKTIAMPDLSGLSMREAGNLLTALGLGFHPQGTGFVTSQSVPAGQSVSAGSQVTVTCLPPKS